jgi:hypothetical protein
VLLREPQPFGASNFQEAVNASLTVILAAHAVVAVFTVCRACAGKQENVGLWNGLSYFVDR